MKRFLLCLVMLSLTAGLCQADIVSGYGKTPVEFSGSKKKKTSKKRKVRIDKGTVLISRVSSDKSYGYSEDNPIKVGPNFSGQGPINERRFMDALAGPNGEDITYVRLGSCCLFDTKNAYKNFGLLDRYEVMYRGLKKPIILYLNMYDPGGEILVPFGFTLKK